MSVFHLCLCICLCVCLCVCLYVCRSICVCSCLFIGLTVWSSVNTKKTVSPKTAEHNNHCQSLLSSVFCGTENRGTRAKRRPSKEEEEVFANVEEKGKMMVKEIERGGFLGSVTWEGCTSGSCVDNAFG